MIAAAICVGDRGTYERYAAPALAWALGPEAPIMEIETDSIFSGYNLALERFAPSTELEALVLLHEDLAINDAAFTAKVRGLLADASVAVIGAIGARDVRSSAWWTGESHGQVSETRGVMGPGRERASVDCVDGIIMILSPWAVQHLRFDEEHFHGFHGYDVDFCLQAVAAGKTVMVEDLDVYHHAKLNAGLGDRGPDDREAYWRADAILRAKWQRLGRPMASDETMHQMRLSYDQVVSEDRKDASEALVELALAHWAAGSERQALETLTRALQEYPSSTLARSMQESLKRAALVQSAERPFHGRGFITLAEASQLIGDGTVLRDYAAQFNGEDDATLLVLAAPEELQELGGTIARAGLGEPNTADITVLSSSRPFAASAMTVAPYVHAVLSAESVRGLGDYRVSADRHGLRFLHSLAVKRAARTNR